MSNPPDCARCGHAYGQHYNTRPTYKATGNKPCHRLGKHDMRCQCRDYVAPYDADEDNIDHAKAWSDTSAELKS